MDELDELIAEALREATDTQFKDSDYNRMFEEGGQYEGLSLEDESFELDEYDLDEYD
jgi:hypothetical protein